MKNKVWESPMIISLNVRETMESNIENIGNPEILAYCPVCNGNGNRYNTPPGQNKPIRS